MNITTQKDENKLTIFLEGKLDTLTAPELDAVINENSDGFENLEVDLEKLEYISSAGLRVFLSAHKKRRGRLVISHPNTTVQDVFDSTGFSDFLNIV